MRADSLFAKIKKQFRSLFFRAVNLIPKKMKNDTLLWWLDLFRKVDLHIARHFPQNFIQNSRNMENHEKMIRMRNGYVEDQAAYTDLAYGKHTMRYSGCEVFAVYNALNHMHKGDHDSLPKLIGVFERDGILLGGRFGTTPTALKDFFQRRGYQAEMTTKPEQFDSVAGAYDTAILTIYNDGQDLEQQIHTIHISKETDGYVAHNTYCNGLLVGPYPTITELVRNIHHGKAKGISLIGISKGNVIR